MKGGAVPATIVTVGHSIRAEDEPVDLLLAHGIELLGLARRCHA